MYSRYECDHIPASRLREGDIVLLEGRSMRSRFVRLLEPGQSRFSHMGVVSLRGGNCYVIHADPDTRCEAYARIRCEPLKELLQKKKVAHYTFYRLSNDSLSAKAAAWALSRARAAVPFDNAFDLHSDSSLYCTELVWKAYRVCGIDLCKGSFDTLRLPFTTRCVLFPARIMQSEYLTRVQ